jgi:methyl-galactoside transport system substrate-binding protein
VGVFYYNFSDAYITTVRNAMDSLLDAAGITYNNYDGAGNQATQLDQINTAITNGANLLVVNIVETSSPTPPSRPAMPPRTPAFPSSSSTARSPTTWSTAMRTALSSAPTPPRPATCRER